MLRPISTVIAALLAVVITIAGTTAAQAESIRLSDDDLEAPPWYLDATSATFTNGRHRIAAVVRQKNFQGEDSADAVSLTVDVPGRTSFHLTWSWSSGKTRLVRVDGHGAERTLRCRGKRVELNAGLDGSVRMSIPQSCLDNTQNVRFAYYITNYSNADASGQDTVPGSSQNDLSFTRWVKRG